MKHIALLSSLLFALVACKSDDKKPSKESKPAAAPATDKGDDKPTAEPAVNDEAAKPDETADDTATAEVDPAAMETDPNATDKLEVIDLKGKAPDDAPVHGTFQGAVAWNDKYGRNALVIGMSQQEKDSTSTLLVADLLLWEGFAWTSQRQFKSSIKECEFDTSAQVHLGDWSVTDLDGNGIGEATWAWSFGCRSDVSPVDHKVFIASSGTSEVDKYVLRGTTAMEMGGAIENKDAFKEADEFGSAPAGFLDHAKKVWGETSVETF